MQKITVRTPSKIGQQIFGTWRNLKPGAKLLLALWMIFGFLVAAGIHGASTPILARYWSRQPYKSYVFSKLDDYLKNTLHLDWDAVDDLLMVEPRTGRADDFFLRIPPELAQLSHNPKFPVVNTNFWNGRNMLAQPQFAVPVWHISALARPGAWGFFFLGAQRGMAWEWWLPIFGCFTVTFLLLEVVLNGNWSLAAFGAFWICESAYPLWEGYLPLYPTFFAALAALSAYHLLRSSQRRIQFLCAAVLGLSVAGFVMVLYPPWCVPAGYLFALIFIGLAIRDRLYAALRPIKAQTVIAILIAIAIAAIIIVAYLTSCWDALKVEAATIYPGHRRLGGGDYPLWWIFMGMYNLATVFKPLPLFAGAHSPTVVGTLDPSTSSSYYLLFPALALPLLLSARWRRGIGVVGWCLVAYILFLLAFDTIGFPHFLGSITLMDRVLPKRSQAGLGPASIVLCLLAVDWARDAVKSMTGRLERLIPIASAASVVPLFVVTGLILSARTHGLPPAFAIAFVSLIAAYASYCIVAGRTKVLCVLVAIALLPLAWTFHPLSTNLDYIYKSELAAKIQELDQRSDRPLWVCYGAAVEGPQDPRSSGGYGGLLVSTLGGRTISGIQWPPPMEFWHALDPDHRYESYYNNVSHVYLRYSSDNSVSISIAALGPTMVYLKIAPDNPVLKAMGAKYILAMDETANEVDQRKFPLVYRSQTGYFSIFEIP